METDSIIKSPEMIIDSKVVKWMEINPRFSDFSIEYLLSPSGPGGQDNRCPCKTDGELHESNSHQPHFDWLQCTRYRPPKLQRARRKEGRQRRKPGRNPRIPFSGTQVAVLEDRFRLGHYLSSSEVERLSNLLCLSETRVKIWFQNRRARERRERELNERNRIKFVNCAEENEDEKEEVEDVRERKGEETEEEKKPQRSKAVVTATAAARPHLFFKNDLNLNGPHSIVSSLRSAFSPCQPLFTKRVFNSIDQ